MGRRATTHRKITSSNSTRTSVPPPRQSNIRTPPPSSNNTSVQGPGIQNYGTQADIHNMDGSTFSLNMNNTSSSSNIPGPDMQAYGSEDNIPPIGDSTIGMNQTNTVNEFSEIEKELVKQPKDELRKGTTYNKEKDFFEHTVNFKNLHGNDKTTSFKVRTKTKSSAQEIRMLGAMELQKDPQWKERTKAAGIGNVYVHGSQNKKWMKKGNITNAQSFHGNTFNHMTNAAGDYIKLSSDGRIGMNKDDPKWKQPEVDKNKNPKFVKRDSGYSPPTYGDRGLPGIGTMSRTGFAGGKRGDDPFKFNPPTGRKGQTLNKVINSRGLPQWIGGLKQTPEKTTKTYKRQVDKVAVGKKRVNKRGVIVGAKSRYNKYKAKRKNTVQTMSYRDTNRIYQNNMPSVSTNKRGGLSQKEKADQRRKELENRNPNFDYFDLGPASSY